MTFVEPAARKGEVEGRIAVTATLDVAAETARTVRLANPLSDEQPLLRTSIVSTMVDALRRNVARGAKDVGLFELGLVVALDGPQASAPTEDVGLRPADDTLAAIHAAVPPKPRHLGILLCGDRDRSGWWGAGRRADVHDVLELVRSLGEALGVGVETAAAVGWSADALEAQAFAYLAVRALKGMPITFPTTTGVSRPTQGGILARPP